MNRIFVKCLFQKMITNEPQECEIPLQPIQISALKVSGKKCVKPTCVFKRKSKVVNF